MKSFFLILFFSATIYSQTLHVKYHLQIDISGTSPKPFNHNYLLTNSNGKSIQKKFVLGNVYGSESRNGSVSTKIVKIGNDTTYIYKNFNEDELMSEEIIFTKPFVVADNLNIFSWEIKNDTLTVLNHKCRKATAKFRGRDYVAYFAEDIPVPDGPAKFNGLPGLILKVEMVDSSAVYAIEATELRFENKNTTIDNPLSSRKITAFADFKKEFKTKYEEVQAYAAGQSGGGSVTTVPKGRLEMLSDE